VRIWKIGILDVPISPDDSGAGIGLGPGAFSVDARVFGRREIIIPRAEFPSD